MPLYPLGISRCRDVPSVPKQAAGSIDVRWSLAGDLACAFIDAPHQAVPPMLHATTLDAIHRRICVLPVRFGVALQDETEIHALLQNRRDELLDHLSRLDWTCEMGLRISPPSSPKAKRLSQDTLREFGHSERSEESTTSKEILRCAQNDNSPLEIASKAASPKPQSALAYIEQRRMHYQRADENQMRDCSIVQQYVERLHGCYRQWRRLPSSPSYPIRLAFLVERDRVTAFRSRLENTGVTEQEKRCTILGPWPPYSFV